MRKCLFMDMKVVNSIFNEKLYTGVPENGVLKAIRPRELEKCEAEETLKQLDNLYRCTTVA